MSAEGKAVAPMPASPPSGEAGTVRLSVDAVRLGWSLRQRLSASHVTRLAEALEDPADEVPAIVARRDTLGVVDGAHRLAAARQAGHATVLVQLVSCIDQEALEMHVVANARHGLPLTRAERRAAALRLMQADLHRSQREVARMCGMSPTTVGKVVAAGVQSGQLPPVSRRLGADGKSYPATRDASPRRRATSWWRQWLRQMVAAVRRMLQIRQRAGVGDGLWESR